MIESTRFIEPKTPLTASLLQGVSSEVWGDPKYGQTAQTLLERYQKSYSVYRMPDGLYVSDYLFSIFGPADKLPLEPQPGLTRNEVARAAGLHIRERRQLPSGLRLKEPSDSDLDHQPNLYMHLRYTDVTRTYLIPFMEQYAWHDHRLHGTLGKAMDVLKAVAGFDTMPEETTARDGDESISYADLRAMIKQSVQQGEISQFQYTAIPRNISCLGHDQVHQARPHSWGELVFNGDVSDGYGANFTWERVAVSSLAALAKGGYQKNAKVAPAYLLKHFG